LVEASRGQLFSPGSALIQLCSNKQRLCERLAHSHVATPRGISFRTLPGDLDPSLFPAVLKPIDGAGSQHVRLINKLADLANIDLAAEAAWRLEQFQPGTPVSVSLLRGPRSLVALPPCSQNLSDDGRFTYHGGATPLPRPLADRATRLALAVAEILPAWRGYLGIDIVLGPAENGSEVVAIEVNPRLTTSYLGLRQACQQNLAEAMWRHALGEPIELSFRSDLIQFNATP
jgi:tyramine---L-glutamate ligase